MRVSPEKVERQSLSRICRHFSTVIQDQMGLRLDAGKMLGEMIVIDRIEQTPIEN